MWKRIWEKQLWMLQSVETIQKWLLFWGQQVCDTNTRDIFKALLNPQHRKCSPHHIISVYKSENSTDSHCTWGFWRITVQDSLSWWISSLKCSFLMNLAFATLKSIILPVEDPSFKWKTNPVMNIRPWIWYVTKFSSIFFSDLVAY